MNAGMDIQEKMKSEEKMKMVAKVLLWDKKGPDWELNPGPLPYSKTQRKNHATRPSGHMETGDWL